MGKRKYTDADLERMTLQVRSAVISAYERASCNQVDAGLGWYHVAHEEARLLAHEYGLTVERASAIIAVLSPLTRWAGNLEDAWRVCSGERVRHALPRNEVKARRILDGEDPADVLGGRKVMAFWDCIRDPYDPYAACMDTWMGRLVGIDPNDLFDVAGVYQAAADGVRAAGKTLGVSPMAVQAVAWLVAIDEHKRGREYTYDGNGVF